MFKAGRVGLPYLDGTRRPALPRLEVKRRLLAAVGSERCSFDPRPFPQHVVNLLAVAGATLAVDLDGKF
jgi:hypothetical protein